MKTFLLQFITYNTILYLLLITQYLKVRYYIATLPHYTTLQHYYITTLVRYFITALLHCCITTLHNYITTITLIHSQ